MRGVLRGTMMAAMASLALSACADPKPLYVDQAWIQLNANPEAPAAGYFTVHGGPEDVILRSVSTEAAQRMEMHESVTGPDRMTAMKPIDSVPIPARTDISFAPGGKHLMIWAVNPQVAATGKVPMTFTFSNGDRLLVDAVVRQPGAGAPAAAPDNSAGHEAH